MVKKFHFKAKTFRFKGFEKIASQLLKARSKTSTKPQYYSCQYFNVVSNGSYLCVYISICNYSVQIVIYAYHIAASVCTNDIRCHQVIILHYNL